jgi:serine/threonine-protein kinase
MMIAHLHEPAPSAAALQSSVPVALDRVLQRCLAKEPGDRFATAAAFDAALVGAMRDVGD